jgi:tRNA modification GTPase
LATSHLKLENVCSLLTPTGRGAVAVIALTGKTSTEVLEQAFAPVSGKPFSFHAKRNLVYGTWKPTDEDIMVCRTGNQCFEIHCHGGNTASAAIIEHLAENGIRLIEADSYREQEIGPWKASSLAALTKATTPRTAKLLLKQTNLLPPAIDNLIQEIESGNGDRSATTIRQMLEWAPFGFHLTQPRVVVLCGQPNVGKSSLVNAIVGFQRAIVHDQAGTTRDVLTQQTAINGFPVALKDTAGLRSETDQAIDEIEAIGIKKALEQIESSDLTICVFDASLPWNPRDQELVETLTPSLIVHNKIDIAVKPNETNLVRPDGLQVSANTGEGIAALIQSIGQLIVPSFPKENSVYPISNQQTNRLREVLRLLEDHDYPKAVQMLRDTV